MASEKKSNGKDLGTPIGIASGLIIPLIASPQIDLQA